jgi:hypothetical protein
MIFTRRPGRQMTIDRPRTRELDSPAGRERGRGKAIVSDDDADEMERRWNLDDRDHVGILVYLYIYMDRLVMITTDDGDGKKP